MPARQISIELHGPLLGVLVLLRKRPNPSQRNGDEDAVRIGRAVAAVALLDIGALDRAAGELLGGVDDDSERVTVIEVARQRLGMEHELAARSAGIGGDDRGLYAELVGGAGLALADAFDPSGAWKE